MDIKELESFKLSDAVSFHDELNPELWTSDGELHPEVYDKLMVIAKDFMSELGLSSLKVDDITISGSNAAYSYTPYSDLDLHILVDYMKLPDNEIYKELFNAKKTVYNDNHDIKVNGVPVELYVQDSNQPHHSIGEYSLLNKDWIKRPTKRRANFDQAATQLKYEKLGELIELAIKTKSINRIEKVLDIIKRYRQAGLDKHGEFGPENLAYKALRNTGLIQDLWDTKQELHSEELSLESYMDEDWHPNDIPPGPEFKPTMPQGTVRVDVSDVYDWYKLGQNISNLGRADKSQFGKGPPSTIMAFGDEDIEHKYINALKKLGLDTTDIDPIDKNQPPGMMRQKVDPTYNVNEILDKQSASDMTWDEGESNELYNEIRATAKDKKNNTLKYNFYEFPKYDLTAIEFSRAVGPWGDNYSIDKSGDQYTVFATLLQAIKNYLSAGKPEYIFFAAKEPSRAKLYQTFVNRFANQFGYKQISADNIPRAVSATLYSSNDTPFLLQKVGQKEQGVTEGDEQQINWVKPNFDFEWHEVEEQSKMKQVPIEVRQYFKKHFPNKEAWLKSVQNGKVVVVKPDHTFEIRNAPHDKQSLMKVLAPTGHEGPIGPAKEKRVNALFDKGGDIEMPIILKTNKGLWLIGGKTRLGTANYIKGIPAKVWMIGGEQDVAEGGAETSWSDGDEKITLQDILELTKHIKQINLPINDNLKSKLIHWDGNPEEIERINQVTVSNQFPILVMLDKQGQIDWILDGNHRLHKAIKSKAKTIPAKLIKPSDLSDKARKVFHIKEASGYIPSEREKNDPRFKTALTVDVKPDSIKKNAKAFGWKISRSGIPPLLRK